MSATAVLALPLLPGRSSQLSARNLAEYAMTCDKPYRQYHRTCQGCGQTGLSPVLRRLPRRPWAMATAKTLRGLIPMSKPRDFQLGIFKCRSTPTGTLPTDQDLFDTIARGLDRSNMPHWNTFTKQAARRSGGLGQALLAALATKSRERRSDSSRAGSHRRTHQGRPGSLCPGAVLEVPRRAGQGQWSVGLQPSRTIWAGPIAPFNFTDGSRPKCGATDQDIYRIFMTGLDGTPMPSFADNIKPDEAWDLVFYLRTLHAPERARKKKLRSNLD